MAPFNALLLGVELLLYFAVLAGLFRLRHALGLGLFVTALGTMHFLETYLAAILYVGVPGGFVVSPGSSVLFAGKLAMLLLLYVKEGPMRAREPIYGLLAGNILVVGLVLLMRQHVGAAGPDRQPDLAFMTDMGWLMVWGTALLYVDALAVVLLFERLRRVAWLGMSARIWLALVLVLTFDQIGFYAALHVLVSAPPDVLLGGWIAKMVSGTGYAVLTGLYLRLAEGARPAAPIQTKLQELFNTLTYRERHRALLDEAGRDPLTGLLSRARLETQGRPAVDLAIASGQEASVILLDLDGFRDIARGRSGAAGDDVLRRTAAALADEIRPTDYLFRFGGDEFVVLAFRLSPEEAMQLSERLADRIARIRLAASPDGVRASVGVATGPFDGTEFDALFAAADARLDQSRAIGRNRATSLDQMLSAAAAAGGDRNRVPRAPRAPLR